MIQCDTHEKLKITHFLIITGRNEVLAKVIFSQACVILFTGGGCSRFCSNFSGGHSRFCSNFGGGIFLGGVPPNFRGGV